MKTEPNKQLICDECECSVHYFCLKIPLNSVPKEKDWYCDQCRNETWQEIENKQKKHLEQKLNEKSKWGFGMACVKRSKTEITAQSNVFGPIPGIMVGTWWRFRVQASEAGVHAPIVAGIHGRENEGAYSIVYSANNCHDVDLGEEIYYTANGGLLRKRKLNHGEINNEDKNTFNQQLKREILALAKNCPVHVNEQIGGFAGDNWRNGKPVRLLRNGNGRISKDKRTKYLPKIGVRYDGLYKVVKYWPETGKSLSLFF